MARKEFHPSVVESVLIKCRRHCCVCGQWCGQKIEVHHIGSSDDDSEDNAIALCFDCHADVGHYNPKHPKGRKYSISELKKLRDLTYSKYSQIIPDIPKGSSDYGRGFHDGVTWAEKIITVKDAWRLLSTCGDFALEILIHFENDDYDTMMDLLLLDSNVDTGMSISQPDGHRYAWSAGQAAGLWDLDGNEEQISLTKRGRIFRELAFTNRELKKRFDQLKEFWQGAPFDKHARKPARIRNEGYGVHDFPAGVMNWLQTEVYSLIRQKADRSQVYVVQNVTPERLSLQDIETGTISTFDRKDIIDLEVDRETGELLIEIR
ncbi:MAG: HNH endonuclease [Syntrophobacteraceae bacterium]